jgi:hypothetical protein
MLEADPLGLWIAESCHTSLVFPIEYLAILCQNRILGQSSYSSGDHSDDPNLVPKRIGGSFTLGFFLLVTFSRLLQ